MSDNSETNVPEWEPCRYTEISKEQLAEGDTESTEDMGMKDYSGPFKPDFKLSDLSKNRLIKLVEQGQMIFLSVSPAFFDVVGKAAGTYEAQEMYKTFYDIHVREYEIPLVLEAMNFKDGTVMSMLKYFQTCPDGARKGTYEYEYKLIHDNHATLTFTVCQTLHFFEKKDDIPAIEYLCGPKGIEHAAFKAICERFNPEMQSKPLVLPPRKSPEDICCIWEFKIEPKDGETPVFSKVLEGDLNEEMQDYRGPYKKDFTFKNLSKDALLRLHRVYQESCVTRREVMYQVMKQRMGEDKARPLWNEMYARFAIDAEVPITKAVMKIEGSDIPSLMKYFQTCQDGGIRDSNDYSIELVSQNHGRISFGKCVKDDHLDKAEAEDLNQRTCGPDGVREAVLEATCKAFNPDIKLSTAHDPGAKRYVWEFKI